MPMNVCPICRADASEHEPNSTFKFESTSSCPIAGDWADDERMAFLTSHVEQDGLGDHDSSARQQMTDFWSKAVAHAYMCSSGLSLEIAALASGALAWHGSVAPALKLAMRDMISSGALVYRRDLEIDKGLVRRMVETPLVYLFGALGLNGNDSNLPAGQFVHRGVLQGLAERLVQHCQTLPEEERTVYLHADGLQEEEIAKRTGAGKAAPWSFQQLCRGASKEAPRQDWSSRDIGTPASMLSTLVGEDLALLADHMVRTKVAMREDGVLKVMTRTAGVGKKGTTADVISETDKDLLKLRCTVFSLQSNVADLERQILDRRRDALKAKVVGQKKAALANLRRMRQFEAARDSRLSSLFTLEQALDQVNRLRSDKQILEAHEAATSALQSCRKAQGLTVERVEDTLNALAEEMTEQQAIGTALVQDNALVDLDETEELERELENLMAEGAEGVSAEAAPLACAIDVATDRASIELGLPQNPRKVLSSHGGGDDDRLDRRRPSPA